MSFPHMPGLLRFAIALTALVATPLRAQKTTEALLQEAVNEELVVGDLQKAIGLYKQVAGQVTTNRRAAAQALANLGRAYEKLGAADAVAAYQRVIREFADQPAPARFARDRLAVLGSAKAPVAESVDRGAQSLLYPDLPTFRARESPQYDISPDGQQIVMRMPPGGADSLLGPSLTIATAGGTVLRTLVPPARQTGRANPRWSPDGKYVAYIERAFVDSDTTFGRLMIVPTSGGAPQTVSDSIEFGGGPAVGGLLWTPDSRSLTLAGTRRFVTFDLDGRKRRDVPFNLPYLGQFTSYSPDGRWLALHQRDPGSEQSEEANVWVMPAEGGRAIQLTHVRGFDGWAHWSRDGQSLYFVSQQGNASHVVRQRIDARSASPVGDPVRVVSFTDAMILYPRQLGDGKRLTFALMRPSSVIRSASVNDPAAHRTITRGVHPTLSPDGRTVYFVGEGVEPPGLFAADLESGMPRRLTSDKPGSHAVPPYVLSPDGQSLAYFVQKDSANTLFVVGTSGGAPRRLTQLASREHLVPTWSPDGRRLAYSHGNGLYVIPSGGGDATKIAHLYRWDGWTVQWSPDGAHVAALAWASPATQNAVFVVPLAGGEPRQLTPSSARGYKEGLRWHPDSRRLTYMYYGDDDRGDGTRMAYVDGSASTVLVDQPRPLWDYVGSWNVATAEYYFIATSEASWGLYAHNESARATRVVWSDASIQPGAGLPAFSRDGRVMTWATTQTARQLWVIENPR